MSKFEEKQLTELTWSAFSIQDGKAPDTDTAIDVSANESIALQIDMTAAGNVSTDTDINIIASLDGTNYDTEVFAEVLAVGDDEIKTVLITTGVKFIKLRADNNDGANNSAPIVRIWERE